MYCVLYLVNFHRDDTTVCLCICWCGLAGAGEEKAVDPAKVSWQMVDILTIINTTAGAYQDLLSPGPRQSTDKQSQAFT